VALSQNEERVILVDGDLRKPQVHNQFGLENCVGLRELFVSPTNDISCMIQAVNSQKLAVLASGGIPPNPAELLISHMMRKILDTLNQEFGVIVVDAPPVLAITDAATLALLMDGVILVAKPGKTRRVELKQALQQLRAVGAPVLGLVLNAVNPSNSRYGYYYSTYYSRYAHYYSERPRLKGLFGGLAKRKKRSSARQPEVIATHGEAVVKPEPLVPEPEVKATEVEE
jgi:non-specific protein-tyrosine kinase